MILSLNPHSVMRVVSKRVGEELDSLDRGELCLNTFMPALIGRKAGLFTLLFLLFIG